MNLIFSVVNGILKAIAWGIALFFGFLIAILVITAISIAYSISDWAGLSLLGFALLVVWMMFYLVKE